MSAMEFARLGVLVFFAICFLQAGLDKWMNFRGNLEYFRVHFAKSPLRPFAGILLPTLALVETVAGATCLIGAWSLGFHADAFVGQWALVLCVLALLMLFAGQRLAQDYAGAASVAGYFAVAILGLLLFAH